MLKLVVNVMVVVGVLAGACGAETNSLSNWGYLYDFGFGRDGAIASNAHFLETDPVFIRSETNRFNSTFVLGVATISLETGEVTLSDTNRPMSETAKEFWGALIELVGSKESVVRTLAKDGEICKVFGHQWESVPHVTLEYRSSGEYPRHRKCNICGKAETQEPRVWKAGNN